MNVLLHKEHCSRFVERWEEQLVVVIDVVVCLRASGTATSAIHIETSTIHLEQMWIPSCCFWSMCVCVREWLLHKFGRCFGFWCQETWVSWCAPSFWCTSPFDGNDCSSFYAFVQHLFQYIGSFEFGLRLYFCKDAFANAWAWVFPPHFASDDKCLWHAPEGCWKVYNLPDTFYTCKMHQSISHLVLLWLWFKRHTGYYFSHSQITSILSK